MNEKEFWEIIENSRVNTKKDIEKQNRQLIEILNGLTAEEIIGFQINFNKFFAESYNGRLWGAAFIILGGCSDDSFDYFRAWFISQGEEIYKTALQLPDSLSKVVSEADDGENEEILYIPGILYKEKTGLDDFDEKVGSITLRKINDDEFNTWSDGQGDIDEAKAKKNFPKLYHEFWDELDDGKMIDKTKKVIEQLNLWHQNDEYEKIIELGFGLPQKERDYQITGHLARAYNNTGRYDDAVLQLNSIREQGINDPLWHFRMGYAILMQKEQNRKSLKNM